MFICAIDTSGREGSIALARGDAESFEILQLVKIAGGRYSEDLISQLAAALQTLEKRKSEIELLAVASGPGSFTGLRVGLSTVKALAEVTNAPITAISVLEAMAFATNKTGAVLTALDAQRNEVFVGEYQVAGGLVSPELSQEALVTAGDFTTWLSARKPIAPTFTPDATVSEKLRHAGLPVEMLTRPAADTYAQLGLRKFLAGRTTGADVLDANYIRRSDAEILNIIQRK